MTTESIFMTHQETGATYGPEPWLEHYWKHYIAGVEPDWKGKNQIIGYFVNQKERKMFSELKDEGIVELKFREDEETGMYHVTSVKYER